MTLSTVVWACGWAADVGTTWRGIAQWGSVSAERNPLARALMRRLGVVGAIGVLGALEVVVVGLHWGVAACAPAGAYGVSVALSCPVSLTLGGVAHGLAAWSNHRGEIVAPLRPILRLYDAVSAWVAKRRRCGVGGAMSATASPSASCAR